MANVREQLNKAFEQEMDRKKFLQYSAGVFLAAFGVSGLINAILSNGRKAQVVSKPQPQATPKKGYGSARFGN